MGSVSVSVLSLFLCADCRAECFHISAALGYALLTVSHLTPAGGPGGLWEEVPAQKLVVSEMWCNIWVFLREDRFQISSL